MLNIPPTPDGTTVRRRPSALILLAQAIERTRKEPRARAVGAAVGPGVVGIERLFLPLDLAAAIGQMQAFTLLGSGLLLELGVVEGGNLGIRRLARAGFGQAGDTGGHYQRCAVGHLGIAGLAVERRRADA